MLFMQFMLFVKNFSPEFRRPIILYFFALRYDFQTWLAMPIFYCQLDKCDVNESPRDRPLRSAPKRSLLLKFIKIIFIIKIFIINFKDLFSIDCNFKVEKPFDSFSNEALHGVADRLYE